MERAECLGVVRCRRDVVALHEGGAVHPGLCKPHAMVMAARCISGQRLVEELDVVLMDQATIGLAAARLCRTPGKAAAVFRLADERRQSGSGLAAFGRKWPTRAAG